MGKAERKKQILDSAARLFSSRRFDEVLMDDIAHEAGVAKGTLYSYFPDKEELYFAVVFEGLSQLNSTLEALPDRQMEPDQQLREVMHAIVAFLRKNRFFFKLLFMEDNKGEGGRGEYRRRWHQERHHQMDVIEAVLAKGAESGVLDIRCLHVEAQILRGMVQSVLHSYHRGQVTAEEMVDVIMRVFLDGVRVRP